MNHVRIWVKQALKLISIGLGIAAVVGSVLALVFHWPIQAGIYGICFLLGSFGLLYAGLMFIGTPSMRYDYLVRGKTLRKQGKAQEVEPMEEYGVVPAITGLILIIAGFVIEAVTHVSKM